MSVADLTLSPLIARVTGSLSSPRPTVTELAPAVGSDAGDVTVTVRGRNFVGKVSVLFGATPATRVRVLSPSEITATAPAGSGTVYVTVSAVGGSSRRTSASKYRYGNPRRGDRRHQPVPARYRTPDDARSRIGPIRHTEGSSQPVTRGRRRRTPGGACSKSAPLAMGRADGLRSDTPGRREQGP